MRRIQVLMLVSFAIASLSLSLGVASATDNLSSKPEESGSGGPPRELEDCKAKPGVFDNIGSVEVKLTGFRYETGGLSEALMDGASADKGVIKTALVSAISSALEIAGYGVGEDTCDATISADYANYWEKTPSLPDSTGKTVFVLKCVDRLELILSTENSGQVCRTILNLRESPSLSGRTGSSGWENVKYEVDRFAAEVKEAVGKLLAGDDSGTGGPEDAKIDRPANEVKKASGELPPGDKSEPASLGSLKAEHDVSQPRKGTKELKERIETITLVLRAGQQEKGITLNDLPRGSTIAVRDPAGSLVTEMRIDGTSWNWTGKNLKGKRVKPGLYFYLLKDGEGNKYMGRIVVE